MIAHNGPLWARGAARLSMSPMSVAYVCLASGLPAAPALATVKTVARSTFVVRDAQMDYDVVSTAKL